MYQNFPVKCVCILLVVPMVVQAEQCPDYHFYRADHGKCEPCTYCCTYQVGHATIVATPEKECEKYDDMLVFSNYKYMCARMVMDVKAQSDITPCPRGYFYNPHTAEDAARSTLKSAEAEFSTAITDHTQLTHLILPVYGLLVAGSVICVAVIFALVFFRKRLPFTKRPCGKTDYGSPIAQDTEVPGGAGTGQNFMDANATSDPGYPGPKCIKQTN